MTCRHCQAENSADIHRCFRCGRRLAGFARPAPDNYQTWNLTAGNTALDFRPSPDAVAFDEAPRTPDIHRIEYQRSLFSGAHKVMELPLPVSRPKRRNAPAPRRSATGQGVARKATAQNGAQQNLVFEDLSAQESVPLIYCDAPVANPLHRAAAGFLDGAMVLASLGLFLITVELCGTHVVLTSTTAPLSVGILAVLALLYKLLFCVCGADTPGMVWTQLRLLNFDGHIPDRDERVQRMFGSFLSYTVGGLGMVWALVDEEKLAWHDHISKTFPTPYYR